MYDTLESFQLEGLPADDQLMPVELSGAVPKLGEDNASVSNLGVTGRAVAVRPAAFRVDEELGAAAVVVRRPHPDAGPPAVSPA